MTDVFGNCLVYIGTTRVSDQQRNGGVRSNVDSLSMFERKSMRNICAGPGDDPELKRLSVHITPR